MAAPSTLAPPSGPVSSVAGCGLWQPHAAADEGTVGDYGKCLQTATPATASLPPYCAFKASFLPDNWGAQQAAGADLPVFASIASAEP